MIYMYLIYCYFNLHCTISHFRTANVLAIKHTKSEKLTYRERIKLKVRENERRWEPICETFVFSFHLQQSCHGERFPDSYTCQNYSV